MVRAKEVERVAVAFERIEQKVLRIFRYRVGFVEYENLDSVALHRIDYFPHKILVAALLAVQVEPARLTKILRRTVFRARQHSREYERKAGFAAPSRANK